ncbi:hypothetical protein Bb109J_c3477 [Bdellovibrio bacteriovorus]|uniref:hypothetical protein n=1 Tax=Bdellovibrio bacteriovorus TaxID=959 RepID=UPI00045C11C5|nr:hypothetical protein [Bdellovibrio bacteriovorus]AHZ85510.1 hypothetical protein EP01_11270 [Bdellovibrio bacteriovorus]BEV70057.1 hypothetical protein Bb109J_c3477 [Bdellovibrio bacteriovorus]
MRFCQLVITSLLSLIAVSAHANNWYDRGNAGFALFCAGQAPIVLDLYEVSTRELGVVKFSKADTAVDKAVDLASRLNSVDPARARQYKDSALDFMASAQFVTDLGIRKTPDLGLVTVPAECTLEQVVFQRNPSILNKARYVVNANLWNQLDADNQAALILHEAIYREVINSTANELFSERVRIFNGIIHSHQVLSLLKTDYLKLLQELHLTTYEENGLKISLGYTTPEGFWVDSEVFMDGMGRILSASLAANQYFGYGGMEYACIGSTVAEMGRVTLDDGNIRTLRVNPDFARDGACNLPMLIVPDSNGFAIFGNMWFFGREQNLIRVDGTLNKKTQLAYKGMTYELVPDLFKTGVYNTTFTFDSKMNLIEVGLGGTPCLNEPEDKVQFVQNLANGEGTVAISDTGKPEQIPVCR